MLVHSYHVGVLVVAPDWERLFSASVFSFINKQNSKQITGNQMPQLKNTLSDDQIKSSRVFPFYRSQKINIIKIGAQVSSLDIYGMCVCVAFYNKSFLEK